MIRIFPICITAALFVIACNEDPQPLEPVVRPVVTFVVPEPDGSIERSFAGVVESVTATSLAFEVGGRVVEVLAKEGQRYSQGDTLARLDTRELQNQLNGAEAQLVEARQSLRRSQQLFETGNASQGQLESAIARQKSAESNYKSAQKLLADAVLKMPYSGIIGSIPIDPQMVVAAGQTAMTIQGEGGKEFEIGIPAEIIGSITTGMKGNVSLSGIPNESFAASVDTISPEVSRNTTYPVTLVFDKKDDRIREGLDGEVALTLSNPEGEVTSIPVTCVATLPHETKYVWIAVPDESDSGTGTVVRRNVTTGALRSGGNIEIRSGLSPGDVVVSRGVHRLEENQVVRLPKD